MAEPAATSWLETFAAFTWMHAAVLAVALPIIVAASALGRRWRGTEKERLFRLTWAGVMLAFIVGVDVYWLLPANYHGEFSWPLQVCDLMAFVACVALMLPYRYLKTLTVFLGIALCSQAFITPIVDQGPIYVYFWYFWLSHTAIIGSAVYIISVERYRPRAVDLALACMSLYAYSGWVIPLNIMKGWNYGFTGNTSPKTATIVSSLGPWPDRLYWLGALATGGMVAIYLVFLAAGAAVRAWSGRRADGHRSV